eukprot:6143098-Prymnesium_polylepis.1
MCPTPSPKAKPNLNPTLPTSRRPPEGTAGGRRACAATKSRRATKGPSKPNPPPAAAENRTERRSNEKAKVLHDHVQHRPPTRGQSDGKED